MTRAVRKRRDEREVSVDFDFVCLENRKANRCRPALSHHQIDFQPGLSPPATTERPTNRPTDRPTDRPVRQTDPATEIENARAGWLVDGFGPLVGAGLIGISYEPVTLQGRPHWAMLERRERERERKNWNAMWNLTPKVRARWVFLHHRNQTLAAFPLGTERCCWFCHCCYFVFFFLSGAVFSFLLCASCSSPAQFFFPKKPPALFAVCEGSRWNKREPAKNKQNMREGKWKKTHSLEENGKIKGVHTYGLQVRKQKEGKSRHQPELKITLKTAIYFEFSQISLTIFCIAYLLLFNGPN